MSKEQTKSTDYLYLYKRMYPYVKPYLFRALLGVLIAIPVGLLDGATAWVIQPFTDQGLFEKNQQFIFWIPILVVVFAVIQGLLKYLVTYMNDWSSKKISIELKKDMFRRLLKNESAFYDKYQSGYVNARYQGDVDAGISGIVMNFKNLVQRTTSALGFTIVLLLNSWQLAIVAVLVLGSSMIPVAFLRKRVKRASEEGILVSGKIGTNYTETVIGNKIIASFNLQDYMSGKYNHQINETFNIGMRLTKFVAWLSPIMYFIASIGVAIVLSYGLHLVNTDQLTPGSFFSFVVALLLLYQPVKNIGGLVQALQNSFVAMERIIQLLDYEPSIKSKENAKAIGTIAEGIEFDNVTFEYEEGVPILNNIDLKVPIGDSIALVGNSGGGKSSLVSLLPRFYDIKTGSLKIDGTDIRDIELNSLRSNIAIVFQDNFLFSGTIKENILLGKADATNEEIQSAIKNAYLDEFVKSLDKGIDTEIGERGTLLSGGQKQRLAIARAIIKDAPIVILDEATSALDNKSEKIVQKALDKLMENKTVFVIAHRLSTIKNVKRIAVIQEGKMVELGTHDELVNIEGGAYQTLYNAQFKKDEVLS